ncbi:MAG: cysteine synthase A [Anaerorhabdus sp.]
MLFNKIVDTIGNTPLVACNNLKKKMGLEAMLYVKVESFNPGGSVKDRIAFNMLASALEEKDINENTTIIEATSGNTGIGLALVCASLNLPCILVMPDTMSLERRRLIQAYGARLELTPGAKGMMGALERANELKAEIENSFIPSQFENPQNPLAHYTRTGHELLNDLSGEINVFVAGVGTGGTVSGVGKVLKESNPTVEIVAVEPKDSPMITEARKGPHKIQGIGAGFIPLNYDPNVVDKVQMVTYDEAKAAAKLIASTEGILVGVSSGAALSEAIKIAANPKYKGKTVVALLPDTGERYLSTDLFDE